MKPLSRILHEGFGLIPKAIHTLARACLLASLAMPATVLAESGNYRVEVIVFKHMYGNAEPAMAENVRSFHELPELEDHAAPPSPVRLDTTSDMFDDLWRRLQRQDDYWPLAMVAWEQTRIDYHPPVRVHDSEVIAEELHFPGAVIYVDLTDENMLQPFVSPLYRLDGSIQLRRSRFLHLDLDLEYRVEDPAWEAAFGDPLADPEEESGDLFSLSTVDESEPPEPFRIHRLKQTRQIRTGTLHYFDTAYLGVMVRVTATGGD